MAGSGQGVLRCAGSWREVRILAESAEGEAVVAASDEIASGWTAKASESRFGRVPASLAYPGTGVRSPITTTIIEILLGVGILSVGFKFASYWDHWVYFPTIPNVLDSVVLVLAGAFLLSRGIRRWHTEVWSPLKTDESAMSPSTSMILMVAITVGLAILLYFMVLWSGPNH